MTNDYKNLLKEWEKRRDDIVRLKITGMKPSEIARKYNISRARVSAIIKRQLYRTD